MNMIRRWSMVACLVWGMSHAMGQESASGGVEVAPLEDPVAVDGSVISRSKQFRVSGGNPLVRGAAAILAEDAKDDLLHLLGESDQWKIPVVIVLHGKPGDASPPRTVAKRLWVVDGVHQLQLDKHLGPGIEVARFKRAVTAMLIHERTLRLKEDVAEDQVMRVPSWLLLGIGEASAWRVQQGDRDLYASLFRQGGVIEPDELFGLDEQALAGLDAATRAACQVSAGAMVMALLEQPMGQHGFREMLGEVASYEGEMPILLRRYFPELNLSNNSLAKWWALQLANMGDMTLLTDVMSVEETEAHLAASLVLELPGEGQLALDQWQRLQALEAKQRIEAVKLAQTSLVQLSYRCFPSYRPLLVEYQKVLIRMAQDDPGPVGRSLEELERARGIMTEKTQRGRDYLDWFEITRARETSGAFDDYLRLKEELKTRKRTRDDGISHYLDRMDDLFDRGDE